jgi:hypothetical protein
LNFVNLQFPVNFNTFLWNIKFYHLNLLYISHKILLNLPFKELLICKFNLLEMQWTEPWTQTIQLRYFSGFSISQILLTSPFLESRLYRHDLVLVIVIAVAKSTVHFTCRLFLSRGWLLWKK